MNIVVTGSSGLLGSEIVRQLENENVISLDIVPGPATQHIISVSDRKKIFRISENADAIIHTAALHGKHMDLDVPKTDFIRTNIEGTLNLLEAAVFHNINKFIFTSTTSIYGKAMLNNKQAVWVDESLVPQPRDIYDISKQAGENLCMDFAEKHHIDAFIFRISRFMEESANDMANYRLYRGIDVRDGASGHILALYSSLKGFNLFNLSNDTLFREEDLALLKSNPEKVILKYYPEAEAIYRENKWQFPGTIDRVYVIRKAKELLGYKPGHNYMQYISLGKD